MHQFYCDKKLFFLFSWANTILFMITIYTWGWTLKRLLNTICLGLVVWACVIMFAQGAVAQDKRSLDLPVLLKDLIETHDRIKASEAQLQSVRHLHKQAQGAWYPQLLSLIHI